MDQRLCFLYVLCGTWIKFSDRNQYDCYGDGAGCPRAGGHVYMCFSLHFLPFFLAAVGLGCFLAVPQERVAEVFDIWE